jgi:hypothetical protein
MRPALLGSKLGGWSTYASLKRLVISPEVSFKPPTPNSLPYICKGPHGEDPMFTDDWCKKRKCIDLVQIHVRNPLVILLPPIVRAITSLQLIRESQIQASSMTGSITAQKKSLHHIENPS